MEGNSYLAIYFLDGMFRLIPLDEINLNRRFMDLWQQLDDLYAPEEDARRVRTLFSFHLMTSHLLNRSQLEKSLQNLIQMGIERNAKSATFFSLFRYMTLEFEFGALLTDILTWAKQYARFISQFRGFGRIWHAAIQAIALLADVNYRYSFDSSKSSFNRPPFPFLSEEYTSSNDAMTPARRRYLKKIEIHIAYLFEIDDLLSFWFEHARKYSAFTRENATYLLGIWMASREGDTQRKLVDLEPYITNAKRLADLSESTELHKYWILMAEKVSDKSYHFLYIY